MELADGAPRSAINWPCDPAPAKIATGSRAILRPGEVAVSTVRGSFIVHNGALAAALVLAVGLAAGPASADVKASFTYEPDIVWSTVVRLLRVDLGYDIAEQDRDNGYLLFVIHENGRDYNGSLELILGMGERGQATVDLSLRIAGLPENSEEGILRKLRTKLREDYGLPPRAPAVTPPPPPPAEEEGTTETEEAPSGTGSSTTSE